MNQAFNVAAVALLSGRKIKFAEWENDMWLELSDDMIIMFRCASIDETETILGEWRPQIREIVFDEWIII